MGRTLLISAGCKIPLSKATVSSSEALLKFHITIDKAIKYSNSKVCRINSLSRVVTENPRAINDSWNVNAMAKVAQKISKLPGLWKTIENN